MNIILKQKKFPPKRTDIEILPIEAANEATKLENPKVMNMIVLGAFLKKKPILKLESVLKGLKKVLPERYHNLLPLNEQAIKRGMELAEEISVS